MKAPETRIRKAWMFWPAVLLILAAAILTNGISLVPPQHYQRLAENPFITRLDISADNYWQETVLLPAIAFILKWNNPISFNLFCFFILATAYLLFAGLSYEKFGFIPALIFTAILAFSPLTTILFSWLGTPDGVTFLFTIPMFFTNSWLLIFLLSILGVTNHAIFLLAALEILALRWISRNTISLRHMIAACLGGITGYLAVWWFLLSHHIQVSSRLEFIFSKNLNEWIRLNALNFPLTVFSLFNVLWLTLILCTLIFYKKKPCFYSLVWVLLLLNYGISFLTFDTTRIFSLISWGVLLQCIFFSYELSEGGESNSLASRRSFLKILAVTGLLAFLSPRYYSWEGGLHPAPLLERILRDIQ